MGSKGIKARKPRRKLPPASGSGAQWDVEGPGSQYTAEGYIRAWGRFARGASSTTGGRRAGANFVALFFLFVLLSGVVAFVISLIV